MINFGVKVNKKIYYGWKAARVAYSLEQIAGTFALGISDDEGGGLPHVDVHKGDFCEIFFKWKDEEFNLIEGYIEDIPISYDGDSHSIAIIGRDKMGDLVDCSAGYDTAREWTDRTLNQIIEDILFPFRIPLYVAVDAGAPFKKVAIQEGETAFEIISRLCRQRGVLPVSYGDGRLILTRAGSTHSREILEYGRNIKSARMSNSNRDRFSFYLLKGQAPGADDAPTASFVGPEGFAYDGGVGRYRPLIVVSETSGDQGLLRDRAKWEATTRAGKSGEISYTVMDWVKPSGTPWIVNQLVTVKDQVLRIDKADRLISGVTFLFDEGSGTRTELKIVNPETFELMAEEETDIGSGFDIMGGENEWEGEDDFDS